MDFPLKHPAFGVAPFMETPIQQVPEAAGTIFGLGLGVAGMTSQALQICWNFPGMKTTGFPSMVSISYPSFIHYLSMFISNFSAFSCIFPTLNHASFIIFPCFHGLPRGQGAELPGRGGLLGSFAGLRDGLWHPGLLSGLLPGGPRENVAVVAVKKRCNIDSYGFHMVYCIFMICDLWYMISDILIYIFTI